jgi:hypothetical protein
VPGRATGTELVSGAQGERKEEGRRGQPFDATYVKCVWTRGPLNDLVQLGVLCRGLVEVLQAARSAKERLQREVTAFEAQRDALLATHWEHMDANWTQQMQHLPLAQVRGDHRGRGEGGKGEEGMSRWTCPIRRWLLIPRACPDLADCGSFPLLRSCARASPRRGPRSWRRHCGGSPTGSRHASATRSPR